MKRRKFIVSTGLSFLGLKSLFGSENFKLPVIITKKRYQILKTKVLIVGGGPAGIGAAIGSAKTGVETLLIENYGFFGGVATWGLGMVINQMRPFEEPRGFVHELLLEKLQNYGEQAVRITTHQFRVNVEYFKAAVLDALDEVGCNYLVHVKGVDAIINGNQLTGVIVSTKSGLVEIRADVVVDCTGDADIAYFAGAPTMKETGRLSPQTLLLNVSNIDTYTSQDMAGVREEKALKKYPLIPERLSMYKVANSNHFVINHQGTREMGNFDITDPYQFSYAECMSRRQVIQMTEAMREFGSGDLKNCEIVGTSPQIGVRETRRIKGAYILTEEDALNGARFDEDAIAWRSGWLDIGFVYLSQMKVHQVPYRALVPEQIDGLLAAGRCISATHVAASAGKSMGNCFATGHAAGIAASLSSKVKKPPRELDVKNIQEILRNDGVDLTKGGETQDSKMAN
jgi:ribulose 1,5-bisphosphate synthetase/thiazole synthase